jgi:NifU-like protein involved in Fe-S cluster formation
MSWEDEGFPLITGGPRNPDKAPECHYIVATKTATRNRFVPLMDLSDLYSEKLLEIAANQRVPGRLRQPDASARRVSRVCGSVIEVDLQVEDGVITGYGHSISACALGQTSAAIVAASIVGTPAEEFRRLSAQMTAMLKADGAPPDGRWSDLRYLEPVRDYAPRHASTLLVFDAVVEALDKVESPQSVAADS